MLLYILLAWTWVCATCQARDLAEVEERASLANGCTTINSASEFEQALEDLGTGRIDLCLDPSDSGCVRLFRPHHAALCIGHVCAARQEIATSSEVQ